MEELGAEQVSKRPISISIRQRRMPKNCVSNLGLERKERKISQNILNKEFLVSNGVCID